MSCSLMVKQGTVNSKSLGSSPSSSDFKLGFMLESKLIECDGFLWNIEKSFLSPCCPKDRIQLVNLDSEILDSWGESRNFLCEECGQKFILKRGLAAEQEFINRKIEMFENKKKLILNIDEELFLVQDDKKSVKDNT